MSTKFFAATLPHTAPKTITWLLIKAALSAMEKKAIKIIISVTPNVIQPTIFVIIDMYFLLLFVFVRAFLCLMICPMASALSVRTLKRALITVTHYYIPMFLLILSDHKYADP
jgi:hypothetical protein